MSLLETTPTEMVVEEVVNVDSVDEHDTDDKTEDTTKEVVQLDTDAKNETEVLEESVHLETAVLEEETGVATIEEEAQTSCSVSEKEEEEEEEKVNNASEEEPEPEREVSTSIEKKEVKVTSLSVGCPVLIQEPSIGKNVYNKNLTQGQMMYKTLKEIRKCNTRRIVDQFENLCF